MALKYEIFTVEADADTKTAIIDSDRGYPKAATKTDGYRQLIKHPTLEKWAAPVDDDLVTACASMSAADRILRYNDTDPNKWKTREQLETDGWFPAY